MFTGREKEKFKEHFSIVLKILDFLRGARVMCSRLQRIVIDIASDGETFEIGSADAHDSSQTRAKITYPLKSG